MNLRNWRVAGILILALGAAFGVAAKDGPDSPGGRPHRVHALVGARLVLRPGEVVEQGTIVIRDGVIEAVGAGVAPPPDARVWNLRGLTVYPGLIEPYLRLEGGEPAGGHDDDEDEPPPPPTPARKGATHENSRVRPERSLADEVDLSKDTLESLREAGFTAALVVPGKGVFRGQSALVSLRDGSGREQVMASGVAQHVAFEHGGWGARSYPGSLMGAIALVRQTLHDAEHHAAAHGAYDANPMGQPRPETNVSLAALAGALAQTQPLVVEVEDAQTLLRAASLMREFELSPWLALGGHDVHRWQDEVVATGAPVIASLNFPPPPRWDDPDEAEAISLESLRKWWLAPAEPALLERAGVRFALTTQGLEDRGAWRARARAAIARGLSEDAALAALTTAPAALLRAPQLGVIAAGGVANLTITDGPLFAKDTAVVEVWVDGARYDTQQELPAAGDLAGAWQVELEGAATLRLKLEHDDGELRAALGEAKDAPRVDARLWRDRLELTVPATLAGTKHDAALTLRIDGRLLRGVYEVGATPGRGAPTGAERGAATGRRLDEDKKKKKKEDAPGEADEKDEGDDDGAPAYTPAVTIGPWATWPPLPERAPRAVLFCDATLWTLGPQGTFRGDLLVKDGVIAAVGTAAGAAVPSEALVIDARGRHLTPGIVDCHSHSFGDGGINEGTHSCTAEVRIADVIDGESVDLYRQLAGGVTTANQLHGSANAIGGQNAVVHLRWGEPAKRLIVEGARPGIKFALGENPKRSNWGQQLEPRYPTSRSGVEELIRERFLAARNYRRELDDYLRAEDDTKVPPRVDLQLEALCEILEGERLVHCHSYRQDEILAMIRLAEEFGFTIGTFQHVLEGYKVAREIAAHGAGASTFSDWWAYKFEVYDAIAHNATIMARAGVLTSINSDSSEMARRLNQEAAKAVRYGGLPEADALALVTLNPARQLALGERLGSLEPGKQADVALWSTSPLSMQAVCDQTWIAGRRYWDRLGRDREARTLVEAERRELLRAAASARWKDEDGAKAGAWKPTFGRAFATSEAEDGRHLHQGCCVAEEGGR